MPVCNTKRLVVHVSNFTEADDVIRVGNKSIRAVLSAFVYATFDAAALVLSACVPTYSKNATFCPQHFSLNSAHDRSADSKQKKIKCIK